MKWKRQCVVFALCTPFLLLLIVKGHLSLSIRATLGCSFACHMRAFEAGHLTETKLPVDHTDMRQSEFIGSVPRVDRQSRVALSKKFQGTLDPENLLKGSDPTSDRGTLNARSYRFALGTGPPLSAHAKNFSSVETVSHSSQSVEIAGICDIFSGQWVLDNKARYPLYSACSFREEAYACQENGRPDNEFEHYRWQPHGCVLPSLNVTHFLERLRGKRMIFVGDSLARQSFQSLLCIIEEGLRKSHLQESSSPSSPLPDFYPSVSSSSASDSLFETPLGGSSVAKSAFPINKRRSFDIRDHVREVDGEAFNLRSPKKQFVFRNYNASIAFYRSTFLVRPFPSRKRKKRSADSDKPRGIIDLDKIDPILEKHGRSANILILNTGHWFSNGPVKYYGGELDWASRGVVLANQSSAEAYFRGVKRVRKWIDTLNHKKTRVVWRSYEPSHFVGGTWNGGGGCAGISVPWNGETDKGPGPPWPASEEIARIVLAGAKGLETLNVTELTRRRPDGHISQWWPKGALQKKNKVQDCTHWCLPGVPDTWSELLSATLWPH
eukprot:TRINITY_DN30125_c0_g1_i1.p1 TRINITY_DN30125_c0_g1~~TRINITY_DN30125_c0_g1_i1.p1  ORF type:complete len:552 (+),score=32.14 TRINITY_DN30125_c0_g1_i1:106-1761(+)